MKIGNIIQRVQSLYSKGVESDDSRLSSRHIYNKMVTVRAKLLTQSSNKKQKINDWNFLILPCVELIKVSAHECPCLPDIGCKVYRTKHPLPKPLSNLDSHLIQWILSIENSKKINETTREAYRYIKGNKYTSNEPVYLLENGHAYFYGKSLPKLVKIKLLINDPLEGYEYPSYCEESNGEDCISPFDRDFPLDEDMVDTLIEMTVQELVIMFSQSREDLTSNSKDSITEQSK